MPIILPRNLPVIQSLQDHNIDILYEKDPHKMSYKIAIMNLMPTVQTTERLWASAFSRHPHINVELVFFHSTTRESSHEDPQHFKEFYQNWKLFDFNELDAIVITGAPLEHLEFKDVSYWDEIQDLLKKIEKYKLKSLLVCWGAQAGLYYFNNIDKQEKMPKLFGVYAHDIQTKDHILTRNISQNSKICISRHTESQINSENNRDDKALHILISSPECGMALSQDKNRPYIIYAQNHFEYSKHTLEIEYKRDMNKNLSNVNIPINYYENNDPQKNILHSWQQTSTIFFNNFLDFISDTVC